MASVSLASLAAVKRLSVEHLAALGLEDDPRGGVKIPYFDRAGDLLAYKLRRGLQARKGSFWPTGRPLEVYGQWRLELAERKGWCLLVEGESDCWCAWHHGAPCLGLPGANTARCLAHELVALVERLYVVAEPGDAGRQFIEGVQKRLGQLRFWGQAFTVQLPTKDIADLHVAGPPHFGRRLQAAMQQAPQLYPPVTQADEMARLLRAYRRELAPVLLDLIREPLADMLAAAVASTRGGGIS